MTHQRLGAAASGSGRAPPFESERVSLNFSAYCSRQPAPSDITVTLVCRALGSRRPAAGWRTYLYMIAYYYLLCNASRVHCLPVFAAAWNRIRAVRSRSGGNIVFSIAGAPTRRSRRVKVVSGIERRTAERPSWYCFGSRAAPSLCVSTSASARRTPTARSAPSRALSLSSTFALFGRGFAFLRSEHDKNVKENKKENHFVVSFSGSTFPQRRKSSKCKQAANFSNTFFGLLARGAV